MDTNNKKIYILMIIAFIMISLIGAISYGFFNTSFEDKVVGNYVVEFGEDYTLSLNGTFTSNISVSDIEMFGSSYDTIVVDENHTLTLELKNVNPTMGYNCTYDYIWRWDETADHYVASDVNIPEYTVSGPFTETQVPNYGINKVLGSDSISVANNSTQTKDIVINTKFYNLANIDQSAHAGKSYIGGIILDNIKCQKNV